MIVPAWIHAALGARLEGVSRRELAARAEVISERYRRLGGSDVIRSAQDALAYALVRMPATFAAVRHAMQQTAERCPELAPTSLLDIGCGPGTATWAALDTWSSLQSLTLIDQNAHLMEMAGFLAAAASAEASLVAGSLPEALKQRTPADLVVASYALTELAGNQMASVLERLWNLTTQMLIIVEPGTTEGFRRILQCREALLAFGGAVAAPCTHAEACPLKTASRWCHFNQRLSRTRDHLLVKSASVNYEDEKFSYLAVSKAEIPASDKHRVLSSPYLKQGNVQLTLCAPDAVNERTVMRRDKQAWKAARHYDWGDAVEIGQE